MLDPDVLPAHPPVIRSRIQLGLDGVFDEFTSTSDLELKDALVLRISKLWCSFRRSEGWLRVYSTPEADWNGSTPENDNTYPLMQSLGMRPPLTYTQIILVLLLQLSPH